MKRYSEYKDSGVKWIGEIPGHWKIVRLKFVTENLDYLREPISAELRERKNPQYDYYGASGIIDKIDHYNVDDKVLLIGEDGANLLMRNLPLVYRAEGKFWVNNHAHILKTRLNDYSFFAHLLESQDYTLFVTGTAQPKLSQFNLGNVPLPISPINEQKIMGKYLDSKVAKIDEYISIAEKKIAALEELKQTIIAEAVTRGIHKDVPMKDSGVKWIGMIPEHWKVNKIRSHFKERRVKVSDKDFQALSVAKIGIVPQLEDACKTDNGDNRKQVLKGDFVVNSRSDRKGSCGISPLDGSVSLINIVLRPFDIVQEYVHYLFRSYNYIEEFYRNGRGIVADLWTTRYSEMRNIQIPFPPLSEQQEIVTYIETKVANINQLCQAERSQIEKLKEYKQRLISDVVTGKVKVTND